MANFKLFLIFLLILVIYPTGADLLEIGGPYQVGDRITIQGITNLNTDNTILVEVYPASFGPTSKYESAMTGGASAIVPVTMDENGRYSWSVELNSTGWSTDKYFVRVEAIGKDFLKTGYLTLTEMKSESIIEEPVQSSPPDETDLLPSIESLPSGELEESEKLKSIPSAYGPVQTPLPVTTNKSPMNPLSLLMALMGVGILLTGFRR
jgi:hypothetical protein